MELNTLDALKSCFMMTVCRKVMNTDKLEEDKEVTDTISRSVFNLNGKGKETMLTR